MSSEIQRLKSTGNYAEAAALLKQRREPAAAARLLAEVWDFDAALRLAREAGLTIDAYRYAVEAKDEAACRQLREALEHTIGEQDLKPLLSFAEQRGRHEDAAHFCLWLEDALGAARHFEAAGRPLKAARLLVTRGRAREAVQTLGRFYKLEQDPEVTLGLAQALIALGRHEKALEVAQSTRMPDALFGKQQRLIVRCLRQLAMHSAADSVEARLGTGGATLHGIRYLAIGSHGRLYDRWLRRGCVEEFSLGPSRRDQLLAFAQIVHPYLQQVLDLTGEHARLEWPTGVFLGEVTWDQVPVRAPRALFEIEEGLNILSEADLAHGAVDEEHVLVTQSRAVLMIPRSPMPSATVEADREALRSLRRRILMRAS